MKTSIVMVPLLATFLALFSVVFAGVASDMTPRDAMIPMKIGCYPMGDAIDPDTAMDHKVDACNRELTGNKCLEYCKCNERGTLDCSTKHMKGCSKMVMSATCARVPKYWWCSCWPAKKRDVSDAETNALHPHPHNPHHNGTGAGFNNGPAHTHGSNPMLSSHIGPHATHSARSMSFRDGARPHPHTHNHTHTHTVSTKTHDARDVNSMHSSHAGPHATHSGKPVHSMGFKDGPGPKAPNTATHPHPHPHTHTHTHSMGTKTHDGRDVNSMHSSHAGPHATHSGNSVHSMTFKDGPGPKAPNTATRPHPHTHTMGTKTRNARAN